MVWANYIPWIVRFLEFPTFWQTDMPVVLSTYVHTCKLSITRKNSRNKRYPFHPLMVDNILSTVLELKRYLTQVYPSPHKGQALTLQSPAKLALANIVGRDADIAQIVFVHLLVNTLSLCLTSTGIIVATIARRRCRLHLSVGDYFKQVSYF